MSLTLRFLGAAYSVTGSRYLVEFAGTRILLLDSARPQEEDARRANRQGYSRHARALPFYTRTCPARAELGWSARVPEHLSVHEV